MISPAAAAQSPAQIIGALDGDGNGTVSKDEAAADMKANFAMVDSKGDGGIDLDELTRILKMAASQRR